MTKKEQEQKAPTVTYYGKKAYRVNPLIVRLKVPERKLPDYRHENIEEDEGI